MTVMNGRVKTPLIALALIAALLALAGGAWAAWSAAKAGLALAAASAPTAALAGGLWLRIVADEQRAAGRYFEMLARIDPRDLTGDLERADLPPLARSNPSFAAAERLKEAFAENCRRARQAEHSRAALEARTQRLRSERDQFKAILDGLAEPVVAIDAFDEVILANPSAAALFGWEGEDPAGRALANLERCEQLVELLTDTRRRKTPTHRVGEVEIRGPEDGEGRWYSVSARGLPTRAAAADDGRAHGAVAVLRDIGGQKAAQKRNAEFVSAVSHEMKTPLSGIKAYVELLADGDAEDEQTREEFLNVINSQTDRLQRLIDNLLNLARIEAGVVHVSKQNRSLNELLEEAFHIVQPAAEAKQIDLRADLSPMYLGVLVDRDMLLQAAINLLSNAIKYTPDGGAVTLRSRLRDDEVAFEVEDTGVGLSEEDRGRVFEKFYRVKKDRQMAQGTGLGLPLAKHIVEDVHGGGLTVASALGQGSTFCATLPGAGQMS